MLPQAEQFDRGARVSGRIKSYRSVYGKLRRNPDSPRTWDSLGDLVAFKAIFPTPAGADQFTVWLSEQDQWHPVLDDKLCEPHELKYRSKQFDLYSHDVTDSKGQPLKIEVQVRTSAVDAWYVVDHRFKYKTVVPPTEDMQRKLNRLIVLTELFDQEVGEVERKRREDPEFAKDRLYESLITTSERLTKGQTSTSRPEGLLETLLTVFVEDADSLPAQIEAFVNETEADLIRIFSEHLNSSDEYVEEVDWIYHEPEAVLIAERAVRRPQQLLAAVEHSNYRAEVDPMVEAFEALR
nr:RelA/SpoT domain-containing protein [Tessaracoccus sp. OS52]